MSRKVVASACNALVQASVGEIFQYELYLYERVVEVESVPEFEFIDQPLMILKRIGIGECRYIIRCCSWWNLREWVRFPLYFLPVQGENDVDWVDVLPDNHVVAVNDIRIDSLEFPEAVRVLQENNGKKCTKLLMQNYSVRASKIVRAI